MLKTVQNLVALLFVAALAATPGVATAQGWKPLFDGHSLNGWTQLDGDPVTQGWHAEDGVLHLTAEGPGGHIVTDDEFADFELVFEWKLARKGNNGIKYRVRDFDGQTLGLEYQLIDDADYGALRPEQLTGAIYDLFAPVSHRLLRPPGEFNRGRIVVLQNRIEHWLNGHLITAATIGSPEWQRQLDASKFHDVAGFGENQRGRIMLTDHDSEVWFRNVFIRSLEDMTREANAGSTSIPTVFQLGATQAGCAVVRGPCRRLFFRCRCR